VIIPNQASPATIVVYGSTGLVGKAVCTEAQRIGYEVIGLSRTKNNTCTESIEIDFLNYHSLARITQDLIGASSIPVAFVFCHRSRVASHLSEVDALLQATAIDIYPYLALKEELNKTKRRGSLNVVTVTSNAAFRFAQDIDFGYHVTKHAQIAASIGLASLPSSLDIFSNIVSFGEVVDNSKQEHDSYHRDLFTTLSRCASGRPVPSIVNVAKAAVMLCKASSFGICGQTLVIDSGLSSITQESIVRLLTS
jgi:enoyl-[acyl-carrier-protein] reductase (NADH)